MPSIIEANMEPLLSFFIRGPKGAGKSALLNAMFAQRIDAGWTESNNTPLTINVSKIPTDMPDERPEVLQFSFGALGGLLPLVDTLNYSFVTSTGECTTTLCSQHTKHSSAILLVVEKDKLECQQSKQPALVQTVNDLFAAQMHGQVAVPLIVVVNKVDDVDDDDVLTKIEMFREFVVDVLRQQGLWSHPVEVVSMSCLHAYLYRSFLSTLSFENMETIEVIRLCRIELGGQGQFLAKDPKNFKSLETDIKSRLQAVHAEQRWQTHCGLSSLVTALTKLVLTEKACFPLLQRRVCLQLQLLPPAVLPPPYTAPARPANLPAQRDVVKDERVDGTARTPSASSSFSSSMISSIGLGFGSINPLFSHQSPIYSSYSSPVLSKKPLLYMSTDTGAKTSSPRPALPADALVTDLTACEPQPQDSAKLTENMVFIILIYKKYAALVPDLNKETRSKSSSSSGIDSVPSHPFFSADIEEFRLEFKSSIQKLCIAQYRKNFTSFMKMLPTLLEEDAVTKDMALLCLTMIDSHQDLDKGGMRSAESWNNARTKSIVMLLELLWSKKLDQGFFSQTLSDSSLSSNRDKIQHQVLVTMQILSASCEFAESHYGLTDRLVVHLFIPFIDALPNWIATMTLPSYRYGSTGKGDKRCDGSHESDEMDTSKGDGVVDNVEDEERDFNRKVRCDMHASMPAVVDLTSEQRNEAINSPCKNEADRADYNLDKPAIVLVHIERCVLALILGREEGGGEESCQAAQKLIRSLVSRKINVRDKIMGYTTCLRELLWSYSDITQKTVYNSLHRTHFSLFFPVIHCPLPQLDEMWGMSLPSEVDYDKEIAHFPYLESERELILRALLSMEVDVGRTPSRARPPTSMASAGRASMHPHSNSVGSDISGTVSSLEESSSRARGDSMTAQSQDQCQDLYREGLVGHGTRTKRKRQNSESSGSNVGKPLQVLDDPSCTTPGIRLSKEGSNNISGATPSRMRIIRKAGEC